MFAFTESAFETLEQRTKDRFHATLLEILARDNPTFFLPLPGFVRRAMIRNGCEHAESWGFHDESSIGAFVALQCQSAADFYQLPAAREILQEKSVAPATRIHRLLTRIPQASWDQLRAGADIRAWFAPAKANQLPERIAARVCVELPPLARNASDAELAAFFNAMPARAGRHGIHTEGGLCVYAAAAAWYGDQLESAVSPQWAQDIFFAQPPLSPPKIVALLRHALLLDTGCMI